MRLLLATSLVGSTLACAGRPSRQSEPPSPTGPCSEIRVGKVAIRGALPSVVPELAVLEGTLDDELRTTRAVASATQTLRFLGYGQATITVARHAGCFIDLDVAVTLGPRFQIASIEFTTADSFPGAERLAVIEDALGTVNTIGGVYIEYRLIRALAVLEQRYHDAGWLEARIADPVASYQPGKVAIRIPVVAGPRFRVGAIRARGAGAAARATVLAAIGIEPGAWYDGPTIRTGIARARRTLDRDVELHTNVSAVRGEIELEAVLEARRGLAPGLAPGLAR